MHGRSPVAALSLIVVLSCAAALPAAASAQAGEVTADQAQAFAPFPVYTVTRPAGLPAHYRTDVLEDHPFCDADVVHAVEVELRRYKLSRAQRWIGMRQTDDPCAVHGTVGKPVRTVKLFGRRVVVRRWCLQHRVTTCKGQPVSHRVHTIKFSLRAGSERTFFYLDATRMSIRAMLRAVRSLRRVDLTRPVVSLREFMSPDQAIFCQISDTSKPHFTWCVISQPFRSGIVNADGSVDVCNMDPNGCIPGGGSGVPVLHPGQTSRLAGFACTAEAAAITCTVAKGAHAGHGFRIDANGAVEVSPP
jgi:hypothetical protein